MDPTSPRRDGARSLDNPLHVAPWRNRIATAVLLVVAVVCIAIAVFAL
jgi:hypothetical protein